MEPEGEKAPAPARSKKPDVALYVPKKRPEQGGALKEAPANPKPSSRDKAQTAGKPRTRPRYSDKSRKSNSKAKRDRGSSDLPNGDSEDRGAENKTEGPADNGGPHLGAQTEVGPVHSGTCSGPPASEVQGGRVVGEAGDSPGEEANQQSSLEQQEAEPEEESWDSLFNDNGDCLDPHLIEEVGQKIPYNGGGTKTGTTGGCNLKNNTITNGGLHQKKFGTTASQ